MREQVRTEGPAPSIHIDGRLHDNIVASQRTETRLRKRQGTWGEITVDKPLTDRFRLINRDNSVFAALPDPGGAWTHSCRASDCEWAADGIRRHREDPGAPTVASAPPRPELSRPESSDVLRKAFPWLHRGGARGRGRPDRPEEREGTRTVWFYRECWPRPTGGHIKHAHYFDHVSRMPGFEPAITFGDEPSEPSFARERHRFWPAGRDGPAARWDPGPRDVLFLEGASDWPFLIESGLETLPNPRINLIQHVRHADKDDERYHYLGERAIRICVSREVADAITATGRTNGPVLTIPNGIDVTPFESAGDGSPAGFGARPVAVTIAGYKSPDLARELSGRLNAAPVEHRLLTHFQERNAYLALLTGSRVAVCLPNPAEGFYLPALEAMALGCVVVTVDCIGNRGFCHHEVNCLIAERCPDALFDMTKRALAMSSLERARMHRRARDIAARHSLDAERERFHSILRDVDRLWRAG